MTLKEIDNKLIGLNTKGIELADSIEYHAEQKELKQAAYEENLRYISALLKLKVELLTHQKELARFEPTEVE